MIYWNGLERTSYILQRPTLLAKVFGCYKLTFRKIGKGKGPGKAKSTQMNLLVMENLFYDRQFTKVRRPLDHSTKSPDVTERYTT